MRSLDLAGHPVSRLFAGLRLERPAVEEVAVGPVRVVLDQGLLLVSGDGEDGEHPTSVLRISIDIAVDDDGLNFNQELGELILAKLRELAPGEALAA